MSYVPLNNSSRHTVTVAILGNFINRKETSMMTLRANRDRNFWVVVGLQDLACLSHIVQFLFDNVLVLALANTIAEVEDTHRDLSSIDLKRTEECAHKLDHVFGRNDLDAITICIGDRSEAGTLHCKIKDVSQTQTSCKVWEGRLTINGANHGRERRLDYTRGSMGNVGTYENRWIFTEEWMITFVEVAGGTT